MATYYYQGKAGTQLLLDNKLITLKIHKELNKIKELDDMFLMVKNDKIGNIFVFKVIKDWKTILNIISQLKSLKYKEGPYKDGVQADFLLGAKKLRLYKSGGRLSNVIDKNGNAENPKKPSTAEQEDGVVYCLNENKFDKEGISKAVGFNFGEKWNNSFQRTFEAISKSTGKDKINIKDYITYRDSDNKKPKFLNEMTDNKILPDKKDNWNPSDIWMVKKGYKGVDILDLCKKIKSGEEPFQELNNLLKQLFEDRKLIGISLKQVTSNKATFKKIEVNLDVTKTIKFKSITKKQKMSALNSYYDINFNFIEKSNTINYMFRLRPKGKSGSIKVYFEGKPPERSTFDGAVSKDMLQKKYFGMDLINFEKKLDKISAKDLTVRELISKLDEDLYDFISKKNDFVDIQDLDKKSSSEYIVKRGAAITYCLFLFHRANRNNIFKDSLLSSLKLNEFSSIHYKVY